MSGFGENYNNGISDDIAFIPKGTIINGDIEISGRLDMFGEVNGNISSDNHVNVIGEVTGNIRANKIDTRDSYIVGNIECMENTNIHENTVIFGNLNANNLVIDGAIQGKIDVKGDIIVGDKAIVDSDIKAKTIQVSNGAAINGHCSLCYADLNVAEFFPKDVEAAPEKAQELQEEKSQESKPKEQEHHSTGSKKKTK